ncbi:MAG: MlaD family protein [Thermodesulfobacteriota bacterium]
MKELEVKKKRSISPVWILPLVALLIGIWLGYKSFQEQGIEITVRIKEATGLTPGKTQIFYKGLPVGMLKELSVTPDLLNIDARIEVVREAKAKLTDTAKIWIVKPEVSTSKITGLETIVTGNYFQIMVGKEGRSSRFFVAEDSPPPLHMDSPGLHLTLISSGDSSLNPESPVLYKKFQVGEVLSVTMDEAGQISNRILIYPQYQDLVGDNTVFWDISSIELKTNLPNFSVKLGTLRTILAGGVSMKTPDSAKKTVLSRTSFTLHKNFEEGITENHIPVTLRFPSRFGLLVGAEIDYRGITVGKITHMDLDDNLESVTATAHLSRSVEKILGEKSAFWLTRATLTITGVEHLDKLLSGAGISMGGRGGKETREFTVFGSRPPGLAETEGLQLILESNELGSLGVGKPVYFRQLQVGRVTGAELSRDSRKVLVHINIEEKYKDLVKENSKFWNSSGIRIKGGLMTSMQINTESMAAFLGGGVSFITPETEMGKEVVQDYVFTLHREPKEAWLSWSPDIRLGEEKRQWLNLLKKE